VLSIYLLTVDELSASGAEAGDPSRLVELTGPMVKRRLYTCPEWCKHSPSRRVCHGARSRCQSVESHPVALESGGSVRSAFVSFGLCVKPVAVAQCVCCSGRSMASRSAE